MEDHLPVGREADVRHADLLDRVVLVALESEFHHPPEVIVPLVDAHVGDVEGALVDGLRRGDEIALDGIDAFHLLVAVLEEGITGIEFLRVAPDDVLGKAGAVGLEVIDARPLRAILPWMDLPRFIGETLSLHPTPKVYF